MKPRYFYPLIGFVIPTVVIGYGIVKIGRASCRERVYVLV